MAPINSSRKRNKQANNNKIVSIFEMDNIINFIKTILFRQKYIRQISAVLLLLEIVINILIINFINYTEIDWKTYMQQVECFLNGTLDYSQISGDTGPIVYPAGHLYIYTALYYLTNAGQNIKFGQYIFALLYITNLLIVHKIYLRAGNIPPFVLMLISFTSYRVHSLFVLRLFNDAVSMFILYVSIYFFIQKRWPIGCAFFSMAVGIKMNILLFAPGLLILLVEYCSILDVMKNLFICAVIQLILAGPFLVTYPVSYIRSSFNLGRVFMHKWTVNWRFIPEEMFVSKTFHLALLCAHIVTLLFVFSQRWRNVISRVFRQCLRFKSLPSTIESSSASRMLVILFTSNLIGIAFSRSLHYQFYLWYYHTIPLLLWSTQYSSKTKLCMWGIIELVWKIYPSTYWSSALLHIVHLTLIAGLWRNRSLNGIVTQSNNKLE